MLENQSICTIWHVRLVTCNHNILWWEVLTNHPFIVINLHAKTFVIIELYYYYRINFSLRNEYLATLGCSFTAHNHELTTRTHPLYTDGSKASAIL